MVLLFFFLLGIPAVQAQEKAADSFSDLIAQFQQEGVIPNENGKFLALGDFEDSYANMGYYSVTPLLEAEHFVLSANLSWSSGNQTPNTMTAGCGIVFNAAENNTDHLLMSVRMDGSIYITGAGNYTNLSYGKFPFGIPTVVGEKKLVFVVDGAKGFVYIDGKQMAQRNDLSVWGNVVGIAVLAGTYQDFGTRCVFRNIEIYTW